MPLTTDEWKTISAALTTHGWNVPLDVALEIVRAYAPSKCNYHIDVESGIVSIS